MLFKRRDLNSASFMELAQPFHVCIYLTVDGMFYRDWIIVPGMYVVQIVFSDREHVLQEKGGAFPVKFPKDNGEASAIFLCLFVMDRPELVNPAAQWDHPQQGGLLIFQAVESWAVCTVLFILHEHIVIYFFKIFIFDMIYITFLVKHMPPPIKSALPCDRAENFQAGHLLDASGGRTIFSGRSFISRQR